VSQLGDLQRELERAGDADLVAKCSGVGGWDMELGRGGAALRALAARGWSITFFERDVEWYRSNRDLPSPRFCDLRLYADWPSIREEARSVVRAADVVLVGSLVADARDRRLARHARRAALLLRHRYARHTDGAEHLHQTEYLRSDQVPLFETYFSFAGGPALAELEQHCQARRAEALYCGVDTLVYRPVAADAASSGPAQLHGHLHDGPPAGGRRALICASQAATHRSVHPCRSA